MRYSASEKFEIIELVEQSSLSILSVVKVFETASRANEGRLWLVWLMTLRGLSLVMQAAFGDSLAFDPFSLQQDCLAASEVDVGRG